MPADMAPTDTQDFAGRLALGTVQFGLDYGINNIAGRPNDATVAEILSTAQAAGIGLLDTAAAYGDSETRLGHYLGRGGNQSPTFHVVTKLAAGPAEQVRQGLHGALERLQQHSVYGVLFHQFAGFRDHPAAWEVLQEAQALGTVQRIGVSLYHPAEAEWLLANQGGVSLVQLPFNVLDQRFGPLLPALQLAGIEVHVRSAFLQGLLLRDPATLPAFFAPLAPKISQLRALSQQKQLPLASLLLLFAAYAPGVSRAVIGVDTAANLRENLAASNHKARAEQLRPELQQLAEETTDFILPYTWPPRS
jgi:aryl-alcohol dehydrogenase-like predicted oxidoreductase